MHDIFKN